MAICQERGLREFSGVMEMLSMVFWVVVSQVYATSKLPEQNIAVRSVVCKVHIYITKENDSMNFKTANLNSET